MAPNYLIGFGERLVRPISLRTGGGPKHYPYTFEEARERLLPGWEAVSDRLASLPSVACPLERSVISITLHPAFLARSYYPGHLFDDLHLHPVGSKARALSLGPRGERSEKPQTAPEIFVVGDRREMMAFVHALPTWRPDTATKDEFRRIEEVQSLDRSRLRPIVGDEDNPPLEVILHASYDDNDDYVVKGFDAFLISLGIRINLEARMYAGGLCFVPMRAPRSLLDKLMDFSFIRAVRRMPKLSLNDSLLRTVSIPGGFRVKLPEKEVVNQDVSVAVFDGGVVRNSDVAPWVRFHDAPGVDTPSAPYQAHGSAVTSALLFGPLERKQGPSVPYSYVDHWRVLDMDTSGSDFELVDVLRRIVNVLSQRRYDAVCLSIGPALPIEDDDVHVWTSTLDTYLSRPTANTLLISACGNTGDDDWESGNARIQPCSDAVNAIGVGAAGSRGPRWARAPYSSIGPGRSPGFVKPDLIAFGGSEGEPFWLLDPRRPGFSAARMGTSYAAPTAGRSGIGIRAHFGSRLPAVSIRALMVHQCNRGRNAPREVGWGRMPEALDQFVVCPEGEVTILYHGTLEPSQFIRFPIPVPRDPIRSQVRIRATFCIISPVDPEDSLNYTRAGLGVTFRPSTTGHPGYTAQGRVRAAHPASPFFRADHYYSTEIERRRDAHKWETVLKAERTFPAGALDQPVFDVEHHARIHGGPSRRRTDIAYALVVSLFSTAETDLYNRVLTAYPGQLEILQPIIEVPITIRQ